VHGHSLQVADIDGEAIWMYSGAEMAKWSEKQVEPDIQRKAWIFFGDGQGHFGRPNSARSSASTKRAWRI